MLWSYFAIAFYLPFDKLGWKKATASKNRKPILGLEVFYLFMYFCVSNLYMKFYVFLLATCWSLLKLFQPKDDPCLHKLQLFTKRTLGKPKTQRLDDQWQLFYCSHPRELSFVNLKIIGLSPLHVAMPKTCNTIQNPA